MNGKGKGNRTALYPAYWAGFMFVLGSVLDSGVGWFLLWSLGVRMTYWIPKTGYTYLF